MLAYCWAHVRRDFLDAGRAFPELAEWALQWQERIGALYHRNGLRREYWNPQRPVTEQSAAFDHYHEALKSTLQLMPDEATRMVAPQPIAVPTNTSAHREEAAAATLSRSARAKQQKVLSSLLVHWSGLTVFVAHPEVPMDNNRAENTIRTPVNGRKSYYGSGSIWSAQLAATVFSLLQTLALWGINPRHWLMSYLDACADNGGKAPSALAPFLPWSMDETRRAMLGQPHPSRAPPAAPTEPAAGHARG